MSAAGYLALVGTAAQLWILLEVSQPSERRSRPYRLLDTAWGHVERAVGPAIGATLRAPYILLSTLSEWARHAYRTLTRWTHRAHRTDRPANARDAYTHPSNRRNP